MATQPTNDELADVLDRIADLLDASDDNPFRVRAYREGARSIRAADQSAAELVRQNRFDDLRALPSIGEGLAALIGDYVTTGKSDLLAQLEAHAAPEAAFMQVPGIGKELAERIVDHLHIKTLEELEEAAHDGRLAKVEGFGSRRIRAVQASLAGMLSRTARRRTTEKSGHPGRPSVELLLAIDAEYRQKAADGDLQKIAPRRFNPENEAWLPLMRTERDGWKFTALYSNTAQAHKLEKTDDWVVIYYEPEQVNANVREQNNTVVTETRGPLEGKRVVRGREAETRDYYKQHSSAEPVPA